MKSSTKCKGNLWNRKKLAIHIPDNELMFKIHSKGIKLDSNKQTKDPKNANLI